MLTTLVGTYTKPQVVIT